MKNQSIMDKGITLDDESTADLLRVLNMFGTGQHPIAERNNVYMFSHEYALECVDRAINANLDLRCRCKNLLSVLGGDNVADEKTGLDSIIEYIREINSMACDVVSFDTNSDDRFEIAKQIINKAEICEKFLKRIQDKGDIVWKG